MSCKWITFAPLMREIYHYPILYPWLGPYMPACTAQVTIQYHSYEPASKSYKEDEQRCLQLFSPNQAPQRRVRLEIYFSSYLLAYHLAIEQWLIGSLL